MKAVLFDLACWTEDAVDAGGWERVWFMDE
jgi:hypothetical protein